MLPPLERLATHQVDDRECGRHVLCWAESHQGGPMVQRPCLTASDQHDRHVSQVIADHSQITRAVTLQSHALTLAPFPNPMRRLSHASFVSIGNAFGVTFTHSHLPRRRCRLRPSYGLRIRRAVATPLKFTRYLFVIVDAILCRACV